LLLEVLALVCISNNKALRHTGQKSYAMAVRRPKAVAVITLLILAVILLFLCYVFQRRALPRITVRLLRQITMPGKRDTLVIFAAHQDDETLGAGAYIAAASREALPRITVRLLRQITMPGKRDTLVIFAAHQDDETLGAGAYMAAASREGVTVYVVFASDGNARGLGEVRKAEALQAMRILGVPQEQVLFLDYPDGRLSECRVALERAIARTIANLHPTIVLATDPADRHPDHSAVGSAVIKKIRESRSEVRLYTYLVHYRGYLRWSGPGKFLLPPPTLIARRWVNFDVSPFLAEKKEQALLQYKSQLGQPLNPLATSFLRKNEIFSSWN